MTKSSFISCTAKRQAKTTIVKINKVCASLRKASLLLVVDWCDLSHSWRKHYKSHKNSISFTFLQYSTLRGIIFDGSLDNLIEAVQVAPGRHQSGKKTVTPRPSYFKLSPSMRCTVRKESNQVQIDIRQVNVFSKIQMPSLNFNSTQNLTFTILPMKSITKRVQSWFQRREASP